MSTNSNRLSERQTAKSGSGTPGNGAISKSPPSNGASGRSISRRTALGALAAGASALWTPRSFADPLLVPDQKPHFAPRAKHVIVLYMSGGYSHVDTFDPKPRLIRDHDVSISMEERASVSGQPAVERFLKAPLWKFQPNEQCGTEVSDLFPRMREQMHEIALIRSMSADHRDHGEATMQLHTGSTTVAMPSMGAWLSYGLGTFNPNLPAHVVIAEFLPYNGPQVWDANFLPAQHRGVRIAPGAEPIADLQPRQSRGQQERELQLFDALNREHLRQRGGDAQLAGRISAFAAAKGLEDEAPAALDLGQETAETLKLYGAEPGDRRSYAAQCIMARRLVERGVRFVELIDSVGACRDNWDAAHRDVKTHQQYADRVDRPIAGLIEDLKRRGLLADTLLVFCTEFGRTPWAQDGKGTNGRNHHPSAFSCWLAGGGVKPGIVFGETDDIGHEVTRDLVHIHDFHATILHLLGLDHTKLTYRYAGRDFRLTDVHGRVVKELLA
jgi:hypothetical protein